MISFIVQKVDVFGFLEGNLSGFKKLPSTLKKETIIRFVLEFLNFSE